MTIISSPHLDQHGNPTSGDATSIAGYDRALDRLLRYDPEVVPIATSLLEGEAVPMANVLMAALCLTSTDPGDVPDAVGCLAALDAQPANERERLHGEALRSWANGEWHRAARRYDDLLTRWPTDLLALMLGHQLDFFVGDAHNLRDRPLRSRAELDPEHPHAGFVDGMAAFGMEESGHYGAALDTGRRAVAANPDDVWAIHAVTHVYEMTGAVDLGIEFLAERTSSWGEDNLFQVHNWWHLAVFHLETGQVDDILAIFDERIHPVGAEPVLLELLDAAALLWRLHLDGVDVGDRFERLAACWAPKAFDEPWYAFNDLHAVVALAGAGRLDEARSLVARLEAWVATGRGANVRMTADVGLPASRAIVAFAEGRDDDVVAELAPIRRTSSAFGGSHAQRDLLQRTLLEAALRSGCDDLARSLTAERVGQRDTSVYGWMQRARALRAVGDDDRADAASERAAALRAGYRIGR
jgi:hypothetical protein